MAPAVMSSERKFASVITVLELKLPLVSPGVFVCAWLCRSSSAKSTSMDAARCSALVMSAWMRSRSLSAFACSSRWRSATS